MKETILLAFFVLLGGAVWFAAAGEPEIPVVASGVVTAPVDENEETGDAPAGFERFFDEGDRLAEEKKYQEALNSWTQGYLLLLPQYRGLKFERSVNVDFMSKETLRRFLIDDVKREYPDVEIKADELFYIHLGFAEPSLDLKALVLDVLTEQVAGFYDPRDKHLNLIRIEPKPEDKKSVLEKLFQIGDAFEPSEQKATLAHELAHALADQKYDLYSMQRSIETDEDALLALSALIEGEAMLVMMMDSMAVSADQRQSFLAKAEQFSRAMQVLESFGSFFSDDVLANAPLVVREALLFPYVKGMSFCAHLTASGDWSRVDGAFRQPPVSTEQILHPKKFLAESRDDPTQLQFSQSTIRLGPDWELLKENVLGEFGIEVLLREEVGKKVSRRAAAGWDGDLYRLYGRRTKSDSGGEVDETFLVWASTWDSETEAIEFVRAAAKHLGVADAESVSAPPGLPKSEHVWSGARGVSVLIRRAEDVWLIDRCPQGSLVAVSEWALDITKSPKIFELQTFKAQKPVEAGGELAPSAK